VKPSNIDLNKVRNNFLSDDSDVRVKGAHAPYGNPRANQGTLWLPQINPEGEEVKGAIQLKPPTETTSTKPTKPSTGKGERIEWKSSEEEKKEVPQSSSSSNDPFKKAMKNLVAKGTFKPQPWTTETERKKLEAQLKAEEIKKAKGKASISSLNSDEAEQLAAGTYREEIEALAWENGINDVYSIVKKYRAAKKDVDSRAMIAMNILNLQRAAAN